MSNYFAVKRIFDIMTSIFLIILLLPLLFFISILILVIEGGPVFYMQERVGKNWELFKIIKFRTMINSSDQGARITSMNDNRITPLGKLLRKFKLDELPQLFNVLKGDMSFVGPRPEILQFAEYYKSDYNKILSVRPGITDWASIKYSNENDLIPSTENREKYYLDVILPDKINLYLEYISNISFTNDLKILFSTIKKVIGL